MGIFVATVTRHALFFDDMNWVERRWTCEQNLIKGAPEVWHSVVTAVDNACQSLKQHYADTSDIAFAQQNGHRVLVNINRKKVPVDVSSYNQRVDIQIIFVTAVPQINVIIGYNKTTKQFPIKSDENHAFLFYNGKEVSADEFSKMVLEETFFKVQETSSPQFHPGGSSSWMG